MEFKDTKWSTHISPYCDSYFMCNECVLMQTWRLESITFRGSISTYREYFGGRNRIDKMCAIVSSAQKAEKGCYSFDLEGDLLLVYALFLYHDGLRYLDLAKPFCDPDVWDFCQLSLVSNVEDEREPIHNPGDEDRGIRCLEEMLRRIFSLLVVQEFSLPGTGFIIDECHSYFPVEDVNFEWMDSRDAPCHFTRRELFDHLVKNLYNDTIECYSDRLDFYKGVLIDLCVIDDVSTESRLLGYPYLLWLLKYLAWYSEMFYGTAMSYWANFILQKNGCFQSSCGPACPRYCACKSAMKELDAH